MALRIELAGQVGLRGDGGVIPTDRLRRPAWVALAYLAAERHRPVRRDELADVVWSEKPPASWDTIVRGLISKLRSALLETGAGRAAVSTAFGCYQLHLGPDDVIDVEEAAANVARAEAALAAGDAVRARSAASRAVEVAARQFLPGAEGVWVERRQAELADVRLRALEAVAQASSGSGDHAAAVEAAEEVVSLSPLRESGHLRLITAHARGGNRAEALRAYERCRTVLIREVGVSPSPSIEAAYLGLLQDDVPAVPRPLSGHPMPAALLLRNVPGFVGRQFERQQLSEAWKRAAVGERQAVFVGGEPGIGKTRLVAELAAQAHGEGAHVLYGRCDEELAAPYEPLSDVVRRCLTHASPEELVARLQAHADELTRLVPEFALRLPGLPRPAPDHPAAARALVADAVDALLAVTASARPVVVVLDDLHWAGEPALAILRRLIRSSTEAPILVVATYRDTELRPDHPLAALLADTRRETSVVRVRLGGVGTEDVVAMTVAHGDVGRSGQVQEVAEALRAHTRGNPFFIGELLRHLTASSESEGHLPDVAEIRAAVPEGVREVVTRRLLRLSPAANRVLTEAAVVGSELDVAFLEEMGTDRDDVLEGLEQAVSAGLVVELMPVGRYGFAHALVRHTIYDELGVVRRARIHRRVGQTLEHLYGRAGRHIALLAHHFCAGAPAGDAARAADYALAAAQAAAEQLAPEEAIAHLDAGLAALDAGRPDPERRWQLLMALAIAFKRAGTADEGWRTATTAAADLAREQGWLPRLVQVALVRSMTGPFNWRDPAGSKLCEEALAVVGDRDPAARAQLLCSLLAIKRERLRTDGEAMVQEALELARRSGDRSALHRTLNLRCIQLKSYCRQQDYIEMREGAAEAHTLPPEPPPTDDPVAWWLHIRMKESVRRSLLHLADSFFALGDRQRFEEELGRLETSSVAHGDTFGVAMAAARRAHLALVDGRFNDVELFCDRTADFATGLGPQGAHLTSIQYRFRLGLERGHLASSLAELAAVTEPLALLPLRALVALGNVLTGQVDEAKRDLLAVLDGKESADLAGPGWLLPTAEVCARLHDTDWAERLYDVLLPRANVFTFPALIPIHPGPTDHFLGMLALTLDRLDDAERHFATALALEDAMAARPLRAHTLYWRARLLRRRRGPGDREEAKRLLAEVTVTTESLGMFGLARCAHDLLACV